MARTGVIDAAADAIEMRPCLAEMPLQEGFVLRPQIERGENPELVHLLGGRRPDAVEPLHRQRFDEARSHRGRDDELTVGLAMVGGELGEELVVGHAGRGRQPGLGADRRPDPLGDLAWPRRCLADCR